MLKGALTRVVALSSLTASAVTTDSVDRALPGRDHRRAAAPRPPTPVRSRKPSPPGSGSASTTILSPSRTAPVARARQLAMYLTRELTDLSLPAIAEAFNRRDHTTVLHAIRRVERSALEDASLSRTLEELTSELRSPGGMDRDRTD